MAATSRYPPDVEGERVLTCGEYDAVKLVSTDGEADQHGAGYG